MHKTLVIIGASGHGKVVVDIAEQIGCYDEILFCDDSMTRETVLGYPIVGDSQKALEYKEKADYIVAIGNSKIRENVMTNLQFQNGHIATLIHPKATVSRYAKIGYGTVVMAGAVINPDSEIGKGCIINTGATVDHDCRIGDFVHVAVGSHLCGTVAVGSHTWIGAGAIVKNNLDICGDCMIGAGAVVVKNIERKGKYMGVPAEKKKMLDSENSGGGSTGKTT